MAEITSLLEKEFGAWSPSQQDGLERITTTAARLPLPHRAYACATAYHETARTMQPVCEMGPVRYFDKYEPGTKLGKALGNTRTGDGYRYRGRGDAQITGRANYRNVGKKLGYDLESNPSKALDPDLAAKILVLGISEGWFTGKKLSDYGTDYVQMRRTVNGTDKAAVIAGYAKKFETAIRTVPPPVGQAKPAPRAPKKPTGFLANLLTLICHS